MLSTQRPEQKSTVVVRLASADDIAHVEAIHKVVNRAYRSGKQTLIGYTASIVHSAVQWWYFATMAVVPQTGTVHSMVF
jgi:hypothetical protein